jgi:transcription elongation factor Elf1
MKIIKDNSVASKPAYPANYICQYCTSEIQLETAVDLKNNISAFLCDAESLKTNSTVLAKGFICPVCNGKNILG